MAEKSNRNKLQEADKRQAALYRLMYWCFKAQEMDQRIQSEDISTLETYEERVALSCLLKNITDAHHLNDLKVIDTELIIHPKFMKLVLFNIYYAELHLSPWGQAIQHMSSRKVVYQGKTIQHAKLPNFLLPTSCLYCGGSLGYQTYAETSIKITKHPDCANAWNKSIRVKHISALEALKQVSSKSHTTSEVAAIYDQLWSSYIELVTLYNQDYIPRYTLIERYKDIPLSAWVEPLSWLQPRNNLLKLPFMRASAQDYGLAITEEEDGGPLRWRPYNPDRDRPALTLSELDAYFIET